MNNFGRLFRISLFGESHGIQVGVTIDGCPAGIPLTEDDLIKELDRRRSGAKGTTPRKESDMPNIVSGVFNNYTTGAPITVLFENANTRSKDYSQFLDIPRPGHADFTAQQKFKGFQDYRGGGHFSGRITLALVTAGAIAKKLIHPVEIKSDILEIGGNPNIQEAIDNAIRNKDSVGGIIRCIATNMPAGLGEPFFDKTESLLAHIIFAIPAIKGLEFGAGFEAAKMWGSENNDNYITADGKTDTNNAGGINGGITSGNDLVLKVVVKPTSSTSQKQRTLNVKTGEMTEFIVEGRHDTCIALRVPVVLESAVAIVLADLMMQEQQIPKVYEKK
ncbi:MAG: chorismate synthase [Bacteroidetes bacterium]|jgi:chorismate synthase|nr:chorismate synthase [Bacteroidota bacterium]